MVWRGKKGITGPSSAIMNTIDSSAMISYIERYGESTVNVNEKCLLTTNTDDLLTSTENRIYYNRKSKKVNFDLTSLAVMLCITPNASLAIES